MLRLPSGGPPRLLASMPAFLMLDFRALCAACGWSPQAVARMCGRRRNAGTEWATGRVRAPPDVIAWLEAIRVALAALPPPTGQK